jgi:hypothetical protein
MGYMTINKVNEQGKISKYDYYELENNAVNRIAELHVLGFTDAFYIDHDVASSGGVPVIGQIKHFNVDAIAKTITLDSVSYDVNILRDNMDVVRMKRDKLLKESDNAVFTDRWQTMDATAQSAWTIYRQALRDLPANTTDPANPTWPTMPASA